MRLYAISGEEKKETTKKKRKRGKREMRKARSLALWVVSCC